MMMMMMMMMLLFVCFRSLCLVVDAGRDGSRNGNSSELLQGEQQRERVHGRGVVA